MVRPEERIQQKVAEYLTLRYPEVNVLVSPAAGFRVSRGMAMRMMRMGYQAGTPDMTILAARGGYFGLQIELKSGKGIVSPKQNKRMIIAQKYGYKVAVARSEDEARGILDRYMILPPTAVL